MAGKLDLPGGFIFPCSKESSAFFVKRAHKDDMNGLWKRASGMHTGVESFSEVPFFNFHLLWLQSFVLFFEDKNWKISFSKKIVKSCLDEYLNETSKKILPNCVVVGSHVMYLHNVRLESFACFPAKKYLLHL